jgi:hypothetical protein
MYQVIYQRHAVERMAQRGVSEEDVMHVLLTGATIQVYPDDTPFPSELILGWRMGDRSISWLPPIQRGEGRL